MTTFTLLDLVYKLKEIVQELVNGNYSLLETYGYCSADGLRESIEDYPGAVIMPPDEEFIESISGAKCFSKDGADKCELVKNIAFYQFESFMLEEGSKWLVNNLIWAPEEGATQKILFVEFEIMPDRIQPKIKDLRVP